MRGARRSDRETMSARRWAPEVRVGRTRELLVPAGVCDPEVALHEPHVTRLAGRRSILDHREWPVDQNVAIREAAIRHCRLLSLRWGEAVPYEELARGFPFEGAWIKLVGRQRPFVTTGANERGASPGRETRVRCVLRGAAPMGDGTEGGSRDLYAVLGVTHDAKSPRAILDHDC